MNNLTVLDGSLALHCSATGSQDGKPCSGENQFSEITLWTQSQCISPHISPHTTDKISFPVETKNTLFLARRDP